MQVKRIWAGDAPTANDLIAEMGDPHQSTVVAHHSRIERFSFELSMDTMAIDVNIRRTPMTIESMATAAGVSPEAVTARLNAVDAQIERVKAALQAEDDADKA